MPDTGTLGSMENRRAIIISIICFAISIILILAYVRVRRAEMTEEFGEEVEVVVATERIPEYAYIRPEMLKTVTVFKKFRQPQTSSDPADIMGKFAQVDIYPEEQIPFTKLITQEGKPVLDRLVEKKWRAVTISVSPNTAVSKLIRPGNHVDVLAVVNYEAPDGSVTYETITVFQNVLVLATGNDLQNGVPTRVNREVLSFLEEQFEARRRKDYVGEASGLATSRPTGNYSNLTLQLTPEDAEKLLFLMNKYSDNRIFFALRNAADQAIVEKLEGTLLDDVLGPESDYGLSKRKLPEPPPPRPPRIIDRRGGVAVPIE